ncbi:MAG TPA: diacylglycerol kinase [Candidatus Angelobacter sp.]|nr:diacylglycerol kinase [Candidatus Angelobacter sp.]
MGDAGRVVLLLNPTSGRGRASAAAPVAVATLQDSGLEVVQVVGHDAADAAARLRRAIDQAPTAAVVGCGGDGTVNLCLQAVAGTDVALGIVPAGTGNDVARHVGMPSDGGEAAAVIADALRTGRRRLVDAGRAVSADGVDRWFLGVLSSGFDSMVNERANVMTWPSGQARYLRAILAELRSFRAVHYVMVVDEGLPSEVREEKAGMLVAVGNATSYGGGMKVCPGALIDDGLLSLIFLDEVSTPRFLRVFPRVFKGTHVEIPEVHEHVATTVRLDAPGQVAYADGERIGPLPVEVRVVPAAVSLLVPPSGRRAT